MQTYIGKISKGHIVNIGASSPNPHIIITGISGSGKSVRIEDIERQAIRNGGTILVFDIDGTHSKIDTEICNYISAQEDGLKIEFLDMSLVKQKKESIINLVQYVMETICPREMHGAVQLGTVRKAILFALENRKKYKSDMEAILQGLKEQEGTAAMGAYNHLCPILEGNIFRDSAKKIKKNKVNIISLQGINPKTQKRIMEIMLCVLWRKIRIAGSGKDRFMLVLDEFQNFDLRKETTLSQMLVEARKYGIQLLLATQTLTIFNKKELAVINQAATKLFFQQSSTDAKKVAELIEPNHKDKWCSELSRLRVGQAITVGALEIAGRSVHQPIITSSDYQEQNNVLLRI